MSCYITFMGRNLDVDDFVLRTGIPSFDKSYKGDLQPGAKNKTVLYSSASLKISAVDFESLTQQVKDAEIFLNTEKENLKCIAYAEGLEFATIIFGVNADNIIDKNIESFYFPNKLISLCAELKLSIEFTVYNF